MARPQTIFIDRGLVLSNICRLWCEAVEALERPLREAEADVEASRLAANAGYQESAGKFDQELTRKAQELGAYHRDRESYARHLRKELDNLCQDGLPYDLHAFSGRTDLSPSERLRTNQAIRQLEAEGLVEIYGRRATALWPTDEGLAKARELASTEVPTDG